MKTKKVLALLVLATMLISILPVVAFGATNPYQSVVDPPTGSAPAITVVDGTKEGNEFTVTIVGDPPSAIYIGSSRPTVDYFYYKNTNRTTADPDEWKYLAIDTHTSTTPPSTGNQIVEVPIGAPFTTYLNANAVELKIKVVSTAASTSQIVFGIDPLDVDNYARNRSMTANGLVNIIQQRRFPAEFSSPDAALIMLNVNGYSKAVNPTPTATDKPANNVDSYTLSAMVTTNGNVPVGGKDVSFSIISGTGATLSATRATTSASGRAEVKIYSNRPGAVEIQARVSGVTLTGAALDDSKVWVSFKPTGVVSIKSEVADNQKVARLSSGNKSFRVSLYDAMGTRMDLITMGHADGTDVSTLMDGSSGSIATVSAEIVKSPSGASLRKEDITYSVHSSGNMNVRIPYSKLNRDGDYELKIYLVNGVSVSWSFNVKDQGDVVVIELSYGSNSYAAGTVLPEPVVVTRDADGYEKREDFSVYSPRPAISISDASFMDGQLNTVYGSFKLKDDKSGPITMTIIDRDLSLVGTSVLNIEKAASYLKLTPASVGAVGGEVLVNIEVVDIDGKLAASGLRANSSLARAAIITRPEGAIASVGSIDLGSFASGKSNVRVSSNKEGSVTLQVIITEEVKLLPGVDPSKYYGVGTTTVDFDLVPTTEKYGGRTYTGAAPVSFGTTTGVGGTIIFIIGAPSYVSGNQAHAAESPAFVENGRTFLGVRDAGASIGATINWDQDTQTATIAKDNIVVKVTVGAEAISITKSNVTTEQAIDAPAKNIAGRVYLPFRALLEAFGYTVTWDQATQSIVCTI